MSYFAFVTPFIRRTLARAEQVNAVFTAVEAGFAQVPDRNLILQGRATYGEDVAGAVNVYVVQLAYALAAYEAGMLVTFQPTAANTGAASLNLISSTAAVLGAKALLRPDGSALLAGDMAAGGVVEARYDGTAFRLMSLAATGGLGYTPINKAGDTTPGVFNYTLNGQTHVFEPGAGNASYLGWQRGGVVSGYIGTASGSLIAGLGDGKLGIRGETGLYLSGSGGAADAILTSGQLLVPGTVFSGTLKGTRTLLQSYSFSEANWPDVVLDNRGVNTTDTTPYRIGGLYGAAFRGINNPAYVAGMWFERYSTSGGASSGGDIVFGTDSLGVASKTSLTGLMRISLATGITMSTAVSVLASLAVAGNINGSSGLALVGGASAANFFINTIAGTFGINSGTRIEVYGTGSGANKIDQYVNATLVSTIDGAGNFIATGNITANSDRRLKTDIEPLTGSLDAILAMQGVRYTRRSDGSRQIGLIAQDVEEVRREYVHTDGDGLKSLAYQNIVADLIEAVKTLSARIEALKPR